MSEVAYFTLNEVKEIFKLFNSKMDPLISCKSLSGGQGNYNYLIETSKGKRMVLCIFHNKPFEEIQILVNLLDHLAKYKFKTTQMITTSIRQINSRYVILKDYIQGHIFQLKDLSQTNLFEMGVELAKLHNIPPPPYLKSYGYRMELFKQITITDATTESQQGENQHEIKEFRDWLNRKQQFLESALSTALPKGLIHADLFWDNVLFLNDNFEAIIDFEESCLFYKAFDLGMCFVGSCIQVNSKFIQLEKAKSVVSGYQTITILTNLEKLQLKHLTEYAAISTAFLRFNIKYAGIPKEKLRDYKEMMRIADWIHLLSVDDFSQAVF